MGREEAGQGAVLGERWQLWAGPGAQQGSSALGETRKLVPLAAALKEEAKSALWPQGQCVMRLGEAKPPQTSPNAPSHGPGAGPQQSSELLQSQGLGLLGQAAGVLLSAVGGSGLFWPQWVRVWGHGGGASRRRSRAGVGPRV